MTERAFQRLAAVASVSVGVATLLYGLVFLFVLTPGDKAGGSAAIAAYVAAPIGREVAHTLLSVGGSGALLAVVAVHLRLRAENPAWATFSLCVGASFTVLTALYGIHSLFVLRAARRLAATGDPALEAGAIALLNAPSPLDPSAFTRYFLSGIWLLVTGALMLRSRLFPDALAYVALAGGIGAILFFVGTVLGLTLLVFSTGLTGSAVVGPLFWIALGYVLWRRSRDPISDQADPALSTAEGPRTGP